jgi:hypothetical protein
VDDRRLSSTRARRTRIGLPADRGFDPATSRSPRASLAPNALLEALEAQPSAHPIEETSRPQELGGENREPAGMTTIAGPGNTIIATPTATTVTPTTRMITRHT